MLVLVGGLFMKGVVSPGFAIMPSHKRDAWHGRRVVDVYQQTEETHLQMECPIATDRRLCPTRSPRVSPRTRMRNAR
eukprot:3954806-Amphidinium_carterae.1